MAGISLMAFEKNFIDTSFDDDFEISMVTVVLIHEHDEKELPKLKESMKGCSGALNHNQEVGNFLLYMDSFHVPQTLYPKKLFDPVPLLDDKRLVHAYSTRSMG
jgi:hypothetical protein